MVSHGHPPDTWLTRFPVRVLVEIEVHDQANAPPEAQGPSAGDRPYGEMSALESFAEAQPDCTYIYIYGCDKAKHRSVVLRPPTPDFPALAHPNQLEVGLQI